MRAAYRGQGHMGTGCISPGGQLPATFFALHESESGPSRRFHNLAHVRSWRKLTPHPQPGRRRTQRNFLQLRPAGLRPRAEAVGSFARQGASHKGCRTARSPAGLPGPPGARARWIARAMAGVVSETDGAHSLQRSDSADDPRQHAGERRSLAVSCHHLGIISAAPWPDDVPVPAFGRRMVCTKCGIVGADARPSCQEQRARESLTGVQWR
jgi:hypothetical protein